MWLTGLSGAGKSTTARALAQRLHAAGHNATVLDGDELRKRISQDLGFSRTDREIHATPVARLAREVVQSRGFAICALISPYRRSRETARQVVGPESFLEIFIDTPLAVCEQRDPKRLYAMAREGQLRGFTGIDDPYEPPLAPDLVLSTSHDTVEQNVDAIVALLVKRHVVAATSISTPPMESC